MQVRAIIHQIGVDVNTRAVIESLMGSAKRGLAGYPTRRFSISTASVEP